MQYYEHGESVLSNACVDCAVRNDKSQDRRTTTTRSLVACCSGYIPREEATTTTRLSKLSEKLSTIGFLQLEQPGTTTTAKTQQSAAQDHYRFGLSPVIYPPPTPPPSIHLSNSPLQQQQQPDTACVDSTGSDLSASSVNEVGKKRKLLGSATSPAMKKSSGGGGTISPPLLSPSVSMRQQPLSPSGVGSGSVASTATTQEFASKTTFVQVDTSSFRELVQKLTGASDSDVEKFPITMTSRQVARGGAGGGLPVEGKPDSTFGGLIPKPVGDLSARRPPGFKLHERRCQTSNIKKLEVKGLQGAAAAFRRGTASYGRLSPSDRLSPSSQQNFPILSPSSRVSTPLVVTLDHVFDKSTQCAPTTPNTCEEQPCSGLPKPSPNPNPAEGRKKDAAAAQFFMHPSPTFQRPPPRSQPELLTLFPLTSPRASETS